MSRLADRIEAEERLGITTIYGAEEFWPWSKIHMSTRQSPPRQSPAHRARKPVTAHGTEASVGHNVSTRRKRPVILDPNNGRDTAPGGRGAAPGFGGPAVTNS